MQIVHESAFLNKKVIKSRQLNIFTQHAKNKDISNKVLYSLGGWDVSVFFLLNFIAVSLFLFICSCYLVYNCIDLYCFVWNIIVLCCILLYSIVLHCSVLCCVSLQSIANCFVLYCIVLVCIEHNYCRSACFPIAIPPNDKHFHSSCMNFVRTAPATTDNCQFGKWFILSFFFSKCLKHS